jgi:ankyrin repeat protein
MMSSRILFIQIIVLIAILCRPDIVNAQQMVVDTSGYIPSFYPGALDYNLMIAASNGHSSEIERLIREGADINAETDEGATPLIFAVTNNKLEAVITLLNYNSDANKITSTYETPLLIAVKNNNFEITEALIRAGAQVDSPDIFGATPLNHASVSGYRDIVDLLLYYGASVDIKAVDGTTPLMASIWAGYPDIADLLIQNGANMEARDTEGITPFMMAALNGDTLIMDLLLKKGVDIYAVNNSSHDALTLSILARQNNATLYLLKNGKNWIKPEGTAIDPYVVASKYGRKEIPDILKRNNVPGKLKYGIDQVAITASSRSCLYDLYTGVSLSFKEPYLNAGIIVGCDMKLWYSRVLVKNSEHLYYQYMDKGAIAYAGLFKDFALTDRPDRSNFALSTSLLAGYYLGNKLKGTLITPENKFNVIPSISFKMFKPRLSVSLGMEYMKSDYYKVGPLWFRIGISYNHFFDNIRTKVKTIKWY